jgi:hypothetical protein
MTARKPSAAIGEAVRVATDALLASLSNPDEATRQAVVRAAELRVLAQEARASALAGHSVIISDIVRLEDLADAAYRALGIVERKPHQVDELTIRFVGGQGCRANELNSEEFERMSALLKRIDGIDTSDPAVAGSDLETALLTIEKLRLENVEQSLRISHLEGQLAAATAPAERPLGVMQILPPAQEQRQLPAPQHQPDEPVKNWAAVLGGGGVPWNSRDGYTRRFD